MRSETGWDPPFLEGGETGRRQTFLDQDKYSGRDEEHRWESGIWYQPARRTRLEMYET